MVVFLAMVPLALLAHLQGGRGFGNPWGERGYHTEVTGVSPSSCSSDQLCSAAKPLHLWSCGGMLAFPFAEGRPSLGSARSLPNLLLGFSPLPSSRGERSWCGAEHRICWSSGALVPGWVPGSPSADACCHPVASAGKFRGAMPSCLLPAILLLLSRSRLDLGQSWTIPGTQRSGICWLCLPRCRESVVVNKEMFWGNWISRSSWKLWSRVGLCKLGLELNCLGVLYQPAP